MPQSPMGVALIGTGFGQKVHLPGLQTHPLTQVVAIYHRDGQKAQAIAQTHQIPHACDNLDTLLALPDVDAVSISTPPFLHHDMGKAVLQAKKHLLLEKPTTLNAEEARELYHLAQAQDLVVTLDFEFRFVPAWQHFAALLQSGYVGQKRLIKIDWLVAGRADATRPWNWYARKDQGGGALGALGSHTFDYIAWLFGPIKQLFANLHTSIPLRPDPSTGAQKAVDADDVCNLVLELEDGTPCQVCISAATYQGRGHWIEVYGDRGTLILGSDNQQDYVHGFRLWGSHNGQPLAEISIPDHLAFPHVFPDGRIAPFIRVVDNWVQGIRVGQAIAPALREGVYSQLVMDTVQQSHATGTWIQVPNLDAFLNA